MGYVLNESAVCYRWAVDDPHQGKAVVVPVPAVSVPGLIQRGEDELLGFVGTLQDLFPGDDAEHLTQVGMEYSAGMIEPKASIWSRRTLHMLRLVLPVSEKTTSWRRP